MVVRIELPEERFEETCKVTIAGMLLCKVESINKKSILDTLRNNISQSGEYFIDFTADADSEAFDYFEEHEEEVNAIFNKYFLKR